MSETERVRRRAHRKSFELEDRVRDTRTGRRYYVIGRSGSIYKLGNYRNQTRKVDAYASADVLEAVESGALF